MKDAVTSENVYELIKKAIEELENNEIEPTQSTFFLSDYIGLWLLDNWDYAHENLLFIPPNPIETYGCQVYVSSELLSKFVEFAIKNNLKMRIEKVKISGGRLK